MQLSLQDNPDTFKSSMATRHDLVYRIKNISHIDVQRLGLLFLFLNLKSELPSVHDALAPALMDGTITVELLESHLHMYFEMRNAHQSQSFTPPTTLALAALGQQLHVILCPNCKRPGHTAKFCVTQGGGMEGMPILDAIADQQVAWEATHQCFRPQGSHQPHNHRLCQHLP